MFEKLDGTLIHVYSDRTGIHFGTTDTAEGEGSVENWSPDGGTKQSFGTFADLFWKAFLETNIAYYKENPKSMYRIVEDGKHFDDEGNPAGPYMQDKPPINRAQAFAWWSGYTLAFELCTPYNIVVTPHSDFRVYLLGARNLSTMEEVGYQDLQKIANALGVFMPRTFEITDPDELMLMVVKQPFSMEGVVACDANFNRRKLKNPARKP